MTSETERLQTAHLRSFIAKPLNPQQARFVEEYLVDLNARAAAGRAGYNPAVGYRLLRRAAVAQAVLDAQAARAARLQITADRVVSELAAIAFADIRRVISWSATEDGEAAAGRCSYRVRASKLIDDQTGSAIAEFQRYSSGAVRLRMHDKLTALAMLGRHLGVFSGLHPPRGPRPAEPEPPAPSCQVVELQSAMTTLLRVAPQLLAAPREADA